MSKRACPPVAGCSAERAKRWLRRAHLLAGVSTVALTIFAAGAPTQARCLFCSGSSASATTAAAQAAIMAGQQAAAIAQQSQQSLARSAAAIQAMLAVQAKARAAALAAPGSSFNGLGPNALDPTVTFNGNGVPSDPTQWINASAPSSTATAGSRTLVQIIQTNPLALLSWKTFNVGSATDLYFNQSAGGANASQWVVLNQVTGNNVAPSQILGSIRAEGSVYVINQNGIIFGGTSQINVGSLIASSMGMTTVGIKNYLSGTGILSTSSSDTPIFAGATQPVAVAAGAQINASSGSLVLLGANVTNEGTLSAPSGQVVMVGGSDVLLAAGDSFTRGLIVLNNVSASNMSYYNPLFNPSTGSNASQGALRDASTVPGTVTNNGLILVPQGNITIVAGSVTQNGILASTTSTTANGSIVVQAQTGNLVLGGASDNHLYGDFGVQGQPSVIQIIPEATDSAQITDIQAIANSSISLTGANVDIRGIVQLHGYDVTNQNDHPGGLSITAIGSSPSNIGQVFLESGGLLDTSGTTDATASASRNSVAVELRSNELADSPVARSGLLNQQTIYVDASVFGTFADGTSWEGTPLANASAWIALTTRSLDERLMNGAPITIGGAATVYAGNIPTPALLPANIVQQTGSTINVSGGYLTYTPGFVRVSSLITADGHLVSVSNADPNVAYAGVCCSFTENHSRWGVTETFTSFGHGGYFNPGYIQGGAGGSITLNVASAVLAGQVETGIVVGTTQRSAPPTYASLTINNANPLLLAPFTGMLFGQAYSADNIIISDAQTATAASWAQGFNVAPGTATDLNTLLTTNSTAQAAPNTVYLPSSWLNSKADSSQLGFGRITLAADDTVALAAGNPLTLAPRTSVSLAANSVDVESAIVAAGGTIALTGAFTSASTLIQNPNSNPNPGDPSIIDSAASSRVTIGAGVLVSAAGAWSNDLAGSAGPLAVNGGAITIASSGNIDLGQGSVLDVSGGAHQTTAGKITAGNGGALTLAAGAVPKAISPLPQGTILPTLAPLGFITFGTGNTLAPGQLLGYGAFSMTGVGAGGSLTLSSYNLASIVAPDQIGGALLSLPPGATSNNLSTSTPLTVSTDFFSTGGFAAVGVTAAGIKLAAGVNLAPQVKSLVITSLQAPSQSSLAGIGTSVLLPAGLRPASVITLHSSGDLWTRGVSGTSPPQISVERDYSLDIEGTITSDAQGSVKLVGDQLAIVAGTVDAPSGGITLSGGTYSYIDETRTTPVPVPLDGEGVWLTGALSATGTPISIPQSNGSVFRDVLPGGQVTVSGGVIVLAPGSLIDVSGGSGLSSLAAAGTSAVSPRGIASSFVATAGGSITINAVLGAALEGNLQGRSGGGDAPGGTLIVSMAAHTGSGGGANPGPGGYWPAAESTFITLQQGVPMDAVPAPGTGLGHSPFNDANIPLSADLVMQGGFASLVLDASVSFAGNTQLNLPGQLVISGSIIMPNGPNPVNAVLGASYVRWGGPGGTTDPNFVPMAGHDTLTINAGNADFVGSLLVAGAQTATFNVSGDLRLNDGVVGSGAGAVISAGILVATGELDFAAGQIYPSTETNFTIASPTIIRFFANGAPPPAPLSVGGVLTIDAPDIEQGGTLRAPTGTINLGVTTAQNFEGIAIPATTTLNLNPGSFTSVAADGETVLFGTVQNGNQWFYNPVPSNPADAVQIVVGQPQQGQISLPAKQITLQGTNIGVASGATLDGSGGGDLYAGEFVQGTGGSKDIFKGKNIYFPANANVFAVLPGYAGITPYDPAISTSGPSAGQQVYLNGVPGLPAGFYTLLPSQYAELPGAFLVRVQSAPSASTQALTRAPLSATATPNGAYVVSGYFATPGSGTTDEHWSLFQVMSDNVARSYSEVDSFFANSFFPAQAAAAGVAVPRLPQDAGQLSIAATGMLSFLGTGVFAHPNGLGGIADISANQILVVDAKTRDAIDGGSTSVLSFVPGGTAGGDGSAFSGTTGTSSGAPYASSAGIDTLVTQSNLDLVAGQTITITDNSNAGNVISGTIAAYDPATGVLRVNVASSSGSLTDTNWTVKAAATDTWNPIVLAAGDLNRLGVESLLLGGSRAFTSTGVNVIATATNIVVANSANDPLSLPDVQLIAAPRQVSLPLTDPVTGASLTGANGSVFTVGTQPGTGQVIITPGAVIKASGAVAAGEPTNYTLLNQKDAVSGPETETAPALGNIASEQNYYQAAADNQFAFVRVSDGALANITNGNASFTAVARTSDSASSAITGWGSGWKANLTQLTVTTSGKVGYSQGQSLELIGSGGQLLTGSVAAINGNSIKVTLSSFAGSGSSTSETILSGPFNLPSVLVSGSVVVGNNAQLTSGNSLTVFSSGFGTIGAATTITARAAEFKSSAISLGQISGSPPSGLVLDQAALDQLAGLNSLTLISVGAINLFGNVNLGGNPDQPQLGNLILDSAGLVGQGGSATLAAAQVTLQNSLGSTLSPTAPTSNTSLSIVAFDGGIGPNGTPTGINNAQISLGAGKVALEGFGSVVLRSNGSIVATGDGGSLNVQSALTLDAPRISAGSMSIGSDGLPHFATVAYAITAADNAASPSQHYAVALQNSGGASPALPVATFGNTLSITGGSINISTAVVLPGGTFDANANPDAGGGNITVGAGGVIDVSGRALQFADALATIGGGDINLSSRTGGIAILPGAMLNVGLSDFAAINKNSAGTLSLSAPNGGVAMAPGTLLGSGPTPDSSGSFVLDTAALDGSTINGLTVSTYASIAAALIGDGGATSGGFAKSWDIRARTGNVAITGLSRATSVTVSADAGDIDVSGTIDAHGAAPGAISIYAGNNLTLESTAILKAHATVADANGRGGQIWLAADAAGNGMGVLTIMFNALGQSAQIDVGADSANAIDSGPVMGGVVTLSTARVVTGGSAGSYTYGPGASSNYLNLAINGGSFASFVNGIKGESAWDGVVIVGNQVYSFTDTTLTVTPTTTIAPNGGVETVAFTTFLNDANTFMNNQPAIWASLGANTTAGTTPMGVVNATGILNGFATGQVLVNIRPGIAVKNAGTITVAGDASNPNGIDLSGSAYAGPGGSGTTGSRAAGSVLNRGDQYALNGHFGQYDEPVVLAIRAGGDLNFGSYSGGPNGTITLGSVSDGFWQYYTNGNGSISALYSTEVKGGGASGAATLFDPAASNAYSGLSGGLGADSASFFLSAGADTNAANPVAVTKNASSGTMTVAGIPAEANQTVTINGKVYSVTADPLDIYNFDTNGGNNGGSNTTTTSALTLANFVDYASLVRTGTGNVSIATAKDLVLQSPLSLIYTGGTGYNVNGSSAAQPLSGFTQYNGMLTISNGPASNLGPDTLPASTFPTHGGDVTLVIGGNITGDMNPNFSFSNGQMGGALAAAGEDQSLPYDMSALGSQLKLQNAYFPGSSTTASNTLSGMGAFSGLYATDSWMNYLKTSFKPNVQTSFYLLANALNVNNPLPTPGNYQLAWYSWFPYLENTIGSFGGGNISVRAGGNIQNVQFVSPSNARDAGPALVGTGYAFNSNLLTNPTDVALNGATPIIGGYSGLYVQGGGNISLTAGGNISAVYTYAQNGRTALVAGGSVGCLANCPVNPVTGVTVTNVTNASGSPFQQSTLSLATATGDVSVVARGAIAIDDTVIEPSANVGAGSATGEVILSGLSLIQNSNFLIDIGPAGQAGKDRAWAREVTVLTGILTSPPTGTVTLQALGDVTLDVNTPGSLTTASTSVSAWNTTQGILPASVQLISLQGDITNDARFITYPDPTGTVNILARGSVNLNQGFVLSDAAPSVMPTLANIAAVLDNSIPGINQLFAVGSADNQTLVNLSTEVTVTTANATSSTLLPSFVQIGQTLPTPLAPTPASNYTTTYTYFGGANYLAGQDITYSVLGGDVPTQLLRGAGRTTVTSSVESLRHAELHLGDSNPARIIALDGDVKQGNLLTQNGTFNEPFEDLAKATEVFAGRDVLNLALLGQNNNPGDVTVVMAGRDITYPPFAVGVNGITALAFGIEIGGPGNVMVLSGRNTDLGYSSGIQTFGNLLNPNPEIASLGAGITIETGVTTPLNYGSFIAQFVNPQTDGSNQLAEPLQLFNAPAGGVTDPYAYLQSLSPTDQNIPAKTTLLQDILLNRIFFGLLRDSGREHTGATGDTNYELGAPTIDTVAQFNSTFANYQRAFAAVNALISVGPGSGNFEGGLSTVRTQAGGNITIMAPNGEIQVGLATNPTGFSGYSSNTDPTYALNFGIVTEKGGNVDLYAQGNIPVNASRIFTLEGGDLIIMSLDGNIDAGKGAKTVQAIQPPNVSIDGYGHVTITPFGPSSGSGIATLRALPNVPLGNADLIAPNGTVNAGDAGIRVSGNLNIGALAVLNAANIQVGGKATGVPVVEAPPVAALTSATNQAGAATKGAETNGNNSEKSDQPSIIIVEFLGFGGGDSETQPPNGRPDKPNDRQSYDKDSPIQILGHGTLMDNQLQALTTEERAAKGRLEAGSRP